jgi:hypothetical protein
MTMHLATSLLDPDIDAPLAIVIARPYIVRCKTTALEREIALSIAPTPALLMTLLSLCSTEES